MKKNDKIEQEIGRTLDHFDHAERLPPDPFFYTRLQARLAEKDQQPGVLPLFMRVALLTVLLVVNIATGLWYLGGVSEQSPTDTRQELAGILATDFKLDNQQNSIFLFEQE